MVGNTLTGNRILSWRQRRAPYFTGNTEWVKFFVRISDNNGMVRIIGDSLYRLEADAESVIAAEMASRFDTTSSSPLTYLDIPEHVDPQKAGMFWSVKVA